ncbi:MAG: hypothetical protein GX780_00910 [Campylobacteraceae bacterium]|nr:hypothetical protein [Campylobacteraceae bacterium]
MLNYANTEEKAKRVKYVRALENFANTTMRVLSHPSEDKNEDRQALLRHANALEKLKTNLSYKKEKHPKKIYNDGY